ncbi:hypothetical protein ACWEQL_21605 [Kitasatospora sp. NPDC004240]
METDPDALQSLPTPDVVEGRQTCAQTCRVSCPATCADSGA